tara:strand:+ start:1307 stop:1753 length:447 start_codon:yes stop_codon:yes gene_type:complete
MRFLLIFSVFLIGCNKEEGIVDVENPYQLRIAWESRGYGIGTNLWTREINLNNKIFIDIDPIYRKNSFSYILDHIYDIDITKLTETNDVKVILTFDCELGVGIRDMIPDYFGIKEEVFVNLYEDKRTVIKVSATSLSNCNPDIKVFYE